MKRVLAVIFAAVVVTPGLAGAAEDLSPSPDPVAPEVEEAVAALPAVAPVPAGTAAPAEAAATVTPGVEPALALEAVPAPPAVPAVPPVAEAPPAAPVTVGSAADDAYAARLHAELCLARPVFCEVDRSGRYLTAPAR